MIYNIVLLCWECRSILKKTRRFRERIQQAQLLLQTPEFYLNHSTSCLSTLQSKIIDNNCEIVYESYNGDKIKLEIHREHDEVPLNDEEILIEPKEEILDEIIEQDTEQLIIKDNLFDEFKNETNQNESEAYNKTKGNNQIDITKIKSEDIQTDTFDYSDEANKDYKVKKRKKKKVVAELRPCRYTKRELINRNTINMERYYFTSDVNEQVLEEIYDRRMSLKYLAKPKYKCILCMVKFNREIDKERHNTLKHLPVRGPYTCCECLNYKAQSLTKLHKHWKTHKMYKCLLCPDVSTDKSEIIQHLIRKHKYIFQCLECGKDFYLCRDIFRHYDEAHHLLCICDHCGKTYNRKNQLEQHMIYKHLPRKCDICGQVCKSAHSLGAHKRICRPDKHFDGNAPELSYCVECDKQYDSVEKYQNHLRTAVQHKSPLTVSFPCPDCGKTFSRKVYMSNHYQLVHMKKSQHYCDICNKYFSSAFSLRTHRESVHEKKYPPKDKICDICGKGFRVNTILNNHKRTHTGEKPYQCSFCPAAFAQNSAKKTHEKAKHKTN
ncbi:PREDICTED: zinc finger protein 135-like isoform X2 [Papilio xuthus]|nr:PREDICTED: zinc finger protein 135-like isoform X2 [Papilio xuthus]